MSDLSDFRLALREMTISRRTLLSLLGASAVVPTLFPASVSALSLMDPFNVGSAMDAGVVKLGDSIPYAGGPRGLLDVYCPQNPTGNAPVVMFIYGGAWKMGERWEYEFVGRALASRGFVTVIPDYRLVPEVAYPAFLYDCAAAAAWVDENIGAFGGDKAKFFLAGHSAGAYNAVMLALDPAYMRDMGANVRVAGVAGLAGPYDFYPFEFGEVRDAFGAAANPEGTQPVKIVTPDAPPMFLASGINDMIVKPINTHNLSEKLREAYSATIWMRIWCRDVFENTD
ncbi:alpha/beta hydrolase [Pelagibacterium halotolerans]|uniref:alpha/beta hydrolase n=1 Tax=Pelagibacterium halotolerans TaxID=531813 RepID=UPI00384F7125